MFFRRFYNSFFFISVSRLFYFFILFWNLIIDWEYDFLICSFLENFSNNKIQDILIWIFFSIAFIFIIKLFLNSSLNLINYSLVNSTLLISFWTHQFRVISIFRFLNLIFFFFSVLFSSITMNFITIYYFLRNIFKRINFIWYPLYRKISYYGYFRVNRNLNSKAFEKNFVEFKN